MIEEIKKEISTLNIHECDIEDIFEILDKYNNQPDYKSAWNELFNFYATDLKDMYSKNDVMVLGRLKDLKKKYNLGGE